MLKWMKNLFAESEKSKERRQRNEKEANAQREREEEEAKQCRLREESRRNEEAHKAKVYRLADENGHLLKELLQLVGSDGGFGNKTRIREIGEELNRIGGMDLMQCAYYGVKNAGRYFSQDIWDGIGSWRC
jgi:hypothetical protein